MHQTHNSPGAIALLLVIVVIVALGIYLADVIQQRSRKLAAQARVSRNDRSIFRAVREARRDFR